MIPTGTFWMVSWEDFLENFRTVFRTVPWIFPEKSPGKTLGTVQGTLWRTAGKPSEKDPTERTFDPGDRRNSRRDFPLAVAFTDMSYASSSRTSGHTFLYMMRMRTHEEAGARLRVCPAGNHDFNSAAEEVSGNPVSLCHQTNDKEQSLWNTSIQETINLTN